MEVTKYNLHRHVDYCNLILLYAYIFLQCLELVKVKALMGIRYKSYVQQSMEMELFFPSNQSYSHFLYLFQSKCIEKYMQSYHMAFA